MKIRRSLMPVNRREGGRQGWREGGREGVREGIIR